MTLDQVLNLKVGDKIKNPMLNEGTGEVVEATPSGVRVVWGPVHGNATRFFYNFASTAWMSWSKVD